MTTTPVSSYADWATALSVRGLSVLPQSHLVPVSVWLRDRATGEVLHFSARGTSLRLRVLDGGDLSLLLLRAECDCEAHRQAGATGRLVVNPGARPRRELVVDGAAAYGWSGHAAALLGVPEAAAHLDHLLDERDDLDRGQREVIAS